MSFLLYLYGKNFRPMKKLLFSLLVTFVFPALAFSQARLETVVPSVDPEADSLYFLAMRQKMDNVRRTQKRPTVAVVLSGGGAKGAAHVGVLKRLEELEIPIDMILGTSIGGLVGGVYALGYNSDFLDTLFTTADWNMLLRDRVPEQYIPYQTKMRRTRFLTTIPFEFGASSREDRKRRQEQMEEAIMQASDASVPSTFMQSLPSGFTSGINVENLIASLSVGYHDSISFMDLPIPFLCVAADIVSGKAKNWTGGDIATAMRSTMSIPGLFLPVRTKDMVLVDGGIRNNYPVDLARNMGADMVIGVTLTAGAADYTHVNNLGDMFGSLIDMLSREAYDANIVASDVHITPDIKGYGMLSFNKEAISELLKKGYESALMKDVDLQRIARMTRGKHTVRQTHHATYIGDTPMFVKDVTIPGMSRRDSMYLTYKGHLEENVSYTAADVNESLYRLYGMGSFRKITYRALNDSTDAYDLEVNCEPGPRHGMSMGVRADNEELVAATVGLGLNLYGLRGNRLEFEGRIGQNLGAMLRYSLILPYMPSISAEVKTERKSVHLLSLSDGNIINSSAGIGHNYLDVFLASHRMRNVNLMAGARYSFYHLRSVMSEDANGVASKDIVGGMRSKWFTAYADMRFYSMDDKYFPSHGHEGGWRFEKTFGDENTGTNAHIFSANWRQVLGSSSWLSFIPTFDTRLVFLNRNKEDVRTSTDYFIGNLVGGEMRGRYLDHQIPFCGWHNSMMMRPLVAAANLEMRARVVPNLYASLIGGALLSSESVDSLLKWTDTEYYLGSAFQLAYKTPVGPIKARLEYSNVTNFGFYIGYGYHF